MQFALCVTLLRDLPFAVWLSLFVPRTSAERKPPTVSWAFHYPPDKFEPTALLDLRGLNEKLAGESGFVRLTADGNGFTLGNGQPVRFWAVGSDLFHKHTPEEMERHARFLAKLGVNMVRLHCDFSPKGKGSKVTDVDDQEIDGVFHFVAAMKKQGIYVTISPFWAHTKAQASWGIAGYADKEPWGVLFFDDTLQAGYKAWAHAVYTRKNPYHRSRARPGPGRRDHSSAKRRQPAFGPLKALRRSRSGCSGKNSAHGS